MPTQPRQFPAKTSRRLTDAVAAGMHQPTQRTQARTAEDGEMSKLKQDHVAGTGGGAVAGGAIGAAIGGLVGGPPGLALGAAAGTAIGAVVGHKASDSADSSGNLGHFRQIFESMPYYVSGRTWDDYGPAYRYGIDTYREHRQRGLEGAEAQLQAGWDGAKRGSTLLWSETRDAIEHAWRELDESDHPDG